MSSIPPWERLDIAAKELLHLQPAHHGTIHPTAVVEGVLELGEGSVIKAGSVIDGHVRIGKNCSIGPNAYVRGTCEIGDNCIIGHAVEVKSSLIGNGVAIAHLSYVGDSVLEDDINIGGGCILSNFRHDAAEIRMNWHGVLTPTHRNKLGAYIGSGARLGCNTTVLPGRCLPPGSRTYPGSVIS
ncbi:MAG: hypothetical protein IJB31_03285 [Akkermansia sp.]|nr:hypothetical protein [Akkermansia sp.]